VTGKRVLEIACGSGFGAGMLADAGATSVVGADVSEEVVEAARRECDRPGVEFVQADGTALPFPDGEFDWVTSFETIEHIPRYEDFVRELRRVVRPGGGLVLSTPNAQVTARYPRNPYHVHEFVPDELRDLLARHYRRVTLLGQRVSPAYRVVPFLPGRERPRSRFDRVRLVLWKVGNRLPFRIKDRLARVLTGRPFYPAEVDYVFGPELDDAPVLVVVCEA
jgi:SAM-dependent methyltransferase